MGLLKLIAFAAFVVAFLGAANVITGVNVTAFGWGGACAWCASTIADYNLPVRGRKE